MAKLDARPGESMGFHCYPVISDESTLGDPEAVIWSSIRHLSSYGVGYAIAGSRHGLRSKRDRQAAANNVKLYIRQAAEFYEVARAAKANTAPLIYYYSFLNLAKALCEFKMPRLHERSESYRHGLSWTPSGKFLVNLHSEQANVSSRGVWHLLWEALMGARCHLANPTKLRLSELFSYCPEITVECEMVFPNQHNLIELDDPDILFKSSTREAWLRFSMNSDDLKLSKVSANNVVRSMETSRSPYTEVRPSKPGFRTFESKVPVKVRPRQFILEALQPDIAAWNVFTTIDEGKLNYLIPVLKRIPIPLPQISILYTILFWLGSLVRYDPHSVADLMDSPSWTLIDGFMSQSRLWLLERMEWALYGTETTLRSGR
jgi:hypothetical protein